ncbi:MAG: nucleotidyltransferase family protein [Candidatus Sumerlaeota bacterium]|nr:nucleotidyltransferase family protein [Candidatus Sumerlaeota bacterium]
MKSPTLERIERLIRERREEMARDYGVAEIGVFGSCVRGEATGESDVDILVEFSRPIGFFRFLELEEKLSGWLGARVDLVTRAALKPRIGRHILEEAVML